MKKISVVMVIVFVAAVSMNAAVCAHSHSKEKNVCTAAPAKDIVSTAIAAGKFKTLVTAVKTAGLVKALQRKGPLTVFAPTDEAFAKLPKGTIENLLLPENKAKLTQILLYHVVSGEMRLKNKNAATLQGEPLKITTDGNFKVNSVKVTAADIEASNGLIHIIDQVLIPQAAKDTPRGAAKKIIELAINRGVPLFNSGNAAACTAVYEVTIESLVKTHANALTNEERAILQKALSKTRKNKEHPGKQAWTLRHALNKVYKSLSDVHK